jgi:hypothetical protein
MFTTYSKSGLSQNQPKNVSLNKKRMKLRCPTTAREGPEGAQYIKRLVYLSNKNGKEEGVGGVR